MSDAGSIRAAAMGDGRAALCRAVLDDPPDWFGIAAAKDAYVSGAAELPMLDAFDGPDPVRFVSVKVHTRSAAELHVLGVLRRHQGAGLAAPRSRRPRPSRPRKGLRFLTVKTLAPSRSDPNSAGTRLFYERMGFVPIEAFPTLWGAANPCLLMLRPV